MDNKSVVRARHTNQTQCFPSDSMYLVTGLAVAGMNVPPANLRLILRSCCSCVRGKQSHITSNAHRLVACCRTGMCWLSDRLGSLIAVCGHKNRTRHYSRSSPPRHPPLQIIHYGSSGAGLGSRPLIIGDCACCRVSELKNSNGRQVKVRRIDQWVRRTSISLQRHVLCATFA